MSKKSDVALFDPAITRAALKAAAVKLNPRTLFRNPVMFVTEVVAVLSTAIFLRDLATGADGAAVVGQIAAWLWFTVYFANFAEAMAEGRGKARADSLRATQAETPAKRYTSAAMTATEAVSSRALRVGDLVLVEAGDLVPADGEVVEGVASVDESAITGESAPVIRESGGDRSSLTGSRCGSPPGPARASSTA
jgi:K+-transporting ATPase ATPase B chain